MQDCYNLGWKIGLCSRGIANREILRTYQSERRRVAHDLIEFDHKFSRLFSGRPAKDAADEAGVSMAEFKDAFEKGNMFASGIAVDYGASMLVAKSGDSKDQGDGTDVRPSDAKKIVGKQELATNLKMGMRFPSFKVLNQSDGRPWHFAEWLKADGRFRVVLFAGDVSDGAQKKRVEKFCESLERALNKFTPAGAHNNTVIQTLTIHSAAREDVDIFSFPEVLRPFDPKRGWDYDQIYVDGPSYHEGNNEAYKNYGVDKKTGCVAISRPDQYVGYIGSLEDGDQVEEYFNGVLVPASQREVAATAVNGQTNGAAGQKKEFVAMNEQQTTDMTAKGMDKFSDSAM